MKQWFKFVSVKDQGFKCAGTIEWIQITLIFLNILQISSFAHCTGTNFCSGIIPGIKLAVQLLLWAALSTNRHSCDYYYFFISH